MQIKRKLSVYLFAIIFFSHLSLMCAQSGWGGALNNYLSYVASNIAKHKETVVVGAVSAVAATGSLYMMYLLSQQWYKEWRARTSAKQEIEEAVRAKANVFIDKNLIFNFKYFGWLYASLMFKFTDARIKVRQIDITPEYFCSFNKNDFKMRLEIYYIQGSRFDSIKPPIEKYPTGIQYKYVRYPFDTNDVGQGQIAQAIDNAIIDVLKRSFDNWRKPDLPKAELVKPTSSWSEKITIWRKNVMQSNSIDRFFRTTIKLPSGLLDANQFKPAAILLKIPKEVYKESVSDDEKRHLICYSSYLYIQIEGPGKTFDCNLFFKKDKSESIDELKPFLEAAKVYRE